MICSVFLSFELERNLTVMRNNGFELGIEGELMRLVVGGGLSLELVNMYVIGLLSLWEINIRT